MVSIRSIAGVIVSAALLVPPAFGHSIKRNPVGYVSMIEEADIHAPSHKVNAFSEFDLTFTLHGDERIRLALEPNNDLLHKSLTVTYLDADGRPRATEPVKRTAHKVYKGSTFIQRPGGGGWSRAGWARITVHRDGKSPIFEGAFRIDGNNHHIQLGKHWQRLKHAEDATVELPEGREGETMVVWRDSDVRPYYSQHEELKRDASNDSLCAVDSLEFNTRYEVKPRSQNFNLLQAMDIRSLFGRQSIDDGGEGNHSPEGNLEATIGSTNGCPSTRQVALVGIATDCTYWNGFDTEDDLRSNVINVVNQASEVYESTFQISLGLQNLTISDEGCPASASESAPWNVDCGTGVEIDDRLNLFSAWRGQFHDTNAYWTLLTTCNTDSAVGLAWRGQLCRDGASEESDNGNNQTVASANVVVRTDTEWQVFAHETGHIFGAVHDCTSSTCPRTSTSELCCPLSTSSCDADGQYIMNPSTGTDINRFSPCSIGNICSGLAATVNGNCLTDNRNIDTITGSQCGNGIVESGEDCDCGGDSDCEAAGCCNTDTCQFTDGSVCDPTNEECCSDQCQYQSSGTVCRASTGECDIEEKCSGDSGKCPKDKHKDNGDSCGDGDNLRCASGQCTSRDLQCQNLAGGLSSTNNTGECDRYDGCQVTCDSSDYGGNTCVTYNQNFIDGSPCSGGGHCSNGSCKGSSTWGEIVHWINNNLQIFIPVVVVVGLLVIAALASCFLGCFKRSKRRRALPKQTTPPQMSGGGWPVYGGNWQDRSAAPNMSGGASNEEYLPPSHPPPGFNGPVDVPPPPTYQYGHPPPGQGPNQWLPRQGSARYA